MEDRCEEPMRGCGKFQRCLQGWLQEALGDKKAVCGFEKGISFLFSTTTMPPKPTPLFCPKSDKEADKAIQEVEDVKAQLTRLNAGLVEFNQKAEAVRAVKAEWQWEHQQLAEEQAEKDRIAEAKERLAWSGRSSWLSSLG